MFSLGKGLLHGLLYYILWFCQASDTKYCKYPIAAQKVPFYCVPAEARNKEGKYGILPDVEKKGLNFPAEYSIIGSDGLNIIFRFPFPKMKGDSQ